MDRDTARPPTRQPHPGRVKLDQNFQKSIPSFRVANVASLLAVEAGLLLTAGLLEGQREDPRHGGGPAARGVRDGPGRKFSAQLAGVGVAVRAVSRHRPVALAGGIYWRAAGAADRKVAAGAAKGASVGYQCVNAPYTQWPERFPLVQRACWLLPSAPARCRWWWRTYAATAGRGQSRRAQGEGERSWVLLTRR